MELRLIRLDDSQDCTLGVLCYYHLPVITTLEPPWRDNVHNVSCIPLGKYQCKRFESKYGTTFQVEVEGRDSIEFHPGNYPQDTKGCILLGLTYSQNPIESAVFDSRKAFLSFQTLTKDYDEITLTVLKSFV